MPFDPEVFGVGGGFDADVFSTPKAKESRQAIANRINNDAISQGARTFPGQGSDALGGASQFALNLLGGGIRGAGSIGATLMAPIDVISDLADGKGLTLASNRQRRADMDAALGDFGAQKDSLAYQGGKLGAEIAGTAAIPGLAGRAAGAVLPAVGVSAPMVNAISAGLTTGGFRVPGMAGLPSFATRIGTGAVSGGLSAGLVDPEQAGAGALIGGALPPAVTAFGRAGQFVSDKMKDAARSLMQSAVKPTLTQLKSGDAATAIDTMLKNGISPNAKGVERLQALIDDADSRITQGIANSNAVIDKTNTLGPVLQTRAQFGAQVSPVSDLQAIDNAVSGYLNHPTYSGMSLPVQDAQALKQGTYRVLAKKYGQMGSADTEAQKAIARGLKDEIAAAVPGVADANADLSRFLTTLDVAQRRALMDANKNPVGLGLLAPTKAGLVGFLADRNAAMKALAARGLYSASPLPVSGAGLLDNAMLLPYVRQGLLATEASP